jgi:hypothetical protein
MASSYQQQDQQDDVRPLMSLSTNEEGDFGSAHSKGAANSLSANGLSSRSSVIIKLVAVVAALAGVLFFAISSGRGGGAFKSSSIKTTELDYGDDTIRQDDITIPWINSSFSHSFYETKSTPLGVYTSQSGKLSYDSWTMISFELDAESLIEVAIVPFRRYHYLYN